MTITKHTEEARSTWFAVCSIAEDFISQMVELGIKHEQIIYKPNAERLSIHVF